MEAHYLEAETLLSSQSITEIPFTTDEPDQKSFYNDKDVSTRFRYAAEEYSSRHLQKRKLWRQSLLVPMLIHVVVLAVYSAIFLHAMKSGTLFELGFGETLYSPASQIVKYEPVIFDARLRPKSAYIGEPSSHVDQAWSDLVEDVHVRISGDDLRLINKSSIALPDEKDAYWGMLGVNHELHCLKRLRQDLYKEHYFPDLTPEEEIMNRMHSSHCIEVLRQAAQCRGDVTVVTMFWGDKSSQPVADFDVPHTCVNWEAIMEWQKERRFDPTKPGYLKHPTLGLAYPNGKTPKLGVAGQ